MSHLLPWLTENVRSAVEKCGALGASVYVPTPWDTSAPGILLHVGTSSPLPEMLSLESASAFAAHAAQHFESADVFDQPAARVLSSAAPEGCFVAIPLLAALWQRSAAAVRSTSDAGPPRRLRRLSDDQDLPPIVGWLGLRFQAVSDQSQRPGGWRSVLELASALASTYVCFYGILTDPVTGLPGRAELNGTLRAELERAQTSGRHFSLLFVKLEDLDSVNERLGRRAGDAVLREFLETLHTTIRNSDTVMRYGGTVFALPLPDVPPTGAVLLGEKILARIGERGFLEGTTHLRCAVAAASLDAADATALQPFDLIRRVDQALFVARRDGCRQAVLWRADGNMASVEPLDPLLGVFTGQGEKDYRNMRLLWDVVQALSSTTGDDLARTVVARMFALCAASRAALFRPDGDRGLRLTAGQQRTAESGASRALSSDDVEPEEWLLNEEALAALTPRHRTLTFTSADGRATSLTAYAVPLVIDGRALGTLYLLGAADVLKIDQSDLPVLSSVAAHLALALDREQLAEQQRVRDQQAQRVLRAELEQLRTVLKQGRLVFRSKAMADLLHTTTRVAATDATVLITGESGTGKEMLAHTLHELSGRRHKPLVIVDCGAIPASLMDSELFGRERGAYTGAERRAVGRLAQADGGTVFLDEVGELPLEVQAKLLRFVQEKTITMVGSTRLQKVDVRIVAATNRALEDEVRTGRFRDDLFHRLNVVRLRIPALRERPDDVLFLAQHFLETFARQYTKDIRGFDADAERLIVAYRWPGNVRELENTLLQAVVLAEGDQVTVDDLRLQPPASGRAEIGEVAPIERDRFVDTMTPAPPRHVRPDGIAPRFEDAWRALADRLAAEVSASAASSGSTGLPLGRWLGRDVVLEAHEQAGRVLSRAATLVGLAETTFSRRLRQAEAEAASTKQTESWAGVRPCLAAVLRAEPQSSGKLADQVDALLFDLIVAAVPHQVGKAASLMGVSMPTMKRRLIETRPSALVVGTGDIVAEAHS